MQPYHMMTKNVSHKKTWNSGMTQAHVEPLSILLIKINHENNSDKDFVKLKLRRYLKSATLELYEFKKIFLTMVIRKSSCFLCKTST